MLTGSGARARVSCSTTCLSATVPLWPKSGATSAKSTLIWRSLPRSQAAGADVGLGVLSAARAMGMDFLPLTTEQYDLIIPVEFYESDLLQPLLSLIRDEEFKQKVEALGGYETVRMGEVVAELKSTE